GMALTSSDATLENVQVLDTLPALDGRSGRGIELGESSFLEATDCLVQGSHGDGVLVETSTAVLQGVQILDTRRDTKMTNAFGLISQIESVVVAADLTVRNTDGPGLYAASATIECMDCTLTDNAFAGAAVVAGGSLLLEDALIEGTVSGSASSGLGVFVDDDGLDEMGAPSLTLQGSTVRDNEMGAVYIKGTGTHRLSDNSLSGGAGFTVGPGVWSHGDAVFVTAGDGSSSTWDEELQEGILIRDNVLSDSLGAGIFLDGASGTLSGNAYEGNTIDLVRQACEGVDIPEGLDEEALTTTELCPDYDYVTQTLVLTPNLYESEAEY
ncbi:MAG: right-handed parallel beta-helix repeat-containing protein, partial [Myxococcota bacterium]|nr:right-handed parallel beta-helix repeat-containing protein [Myxococcota bacterium]